MKKSSLDYWDVRWGASPSNFETSWPDDYARHLELEFLVAKLPRTGKIIEIGCGNFQLAEDPRLVKMLKGRYLGLDGSKVAVEAAQARQIDGLEFGICDLSEPVELPDGDIILSKRTIQNLAPDAHRYELLRQLRKYAHGILIEDCEWARHETDKDRARIGREPLAVPEFNWPLRIDEMLASPATRTETFMGYFYAITRVFPDLPQAGFIAGHHLSHVAIREGRNQPLRGPVVALTW